MLASSPYLSSATCVTATRCTVIDFMFMVCALTHAAYPRPSRDRSTLLHGKGVAGHTRRLPVLQCVTPQASTLLERQAHGRFQMSRLDPGRAAVAANGRLQAHAAR